ncbi:hypothetical protein LTR66_010912 [Elasticomyces elasticus]|nr:hypothetical protein LTR66_010912 [Elasticomyces elasticus]
MASLPPQRRSSPPDQSSAANAARPSQRSNSQAPSATSDDSQTVFLNNPTSPSASTSEPVPIEAPPQKVTQTPLPAVDDDDVRKCWICFADETEDTPETSQWRHPCPCALVAHEDCLLDWIADMEALSTRKRTIAPPKIQCPQCKSEIHLSRPRNYVVEAVRAMERLSNRVVTPGALFVALYTLNEACYMHGISSVYAIFGRDDGQRILFPVILDTLRPPSELRVDFANISLLARSLISSSARNQLSVMFTHSGHRWLDPFLRYLSHWRLRLGLSLISPILVISRTTLADSILPVLPIVFFATQGQSDVEGMNIGKWPPSAAMTLAVLPYLRGAYNTYYERVWAEKEKKWLKEIQPRSGETADEDGDGHEHDHDHDDDGGDGNMLEVLIDGGILDNWGEDDEAEIEEELQQMEEQQDRIRQDLLRNGPVPNAEQQAHPLNQPPIADDVAPQGQDQGQQPRPHVHAHPPNERRLAFSTSAVAQTVLGALLFPSIAAISGELLKLALPRSWTTPPSLSSPSKLGGLIRVASRTSKATGILQERWGRSVIGGCLFVVVKDAVMLYVRWKMAQGHRRRRVLNHDKKTGRVLK